MASSAAASLTSDHRYAGVLGTELCCSSIRGNADPGVVFFALGVFGVFMVALGLFRGVLSSKGSQKTLTGGRFGATLPKITLNKTLIDGQEVTVMDNARISQLVDGLKAPGAARAILDPNSPVWAELNDALRGPGVLDANSPFPVIVQVRSAMQTGQLDSVRHLLSDQLYQRLSASPPVPVASPPRLYMVTNQQSGDDPDRITVRVVGSVVVPGAAADNWTMVRAAQGATTPPAASLSGPPTACPYCGAQLEAGSTKCRYCGMDATQAAPPMPPSTPAAGAGWIVDNISAAAAGPMTA